FYLRSSLPIALLVVGSLHMQTARFLCEAHSEFADGSIDSSRCTGKTVEVEGSLLAAAPAGTHSISNAYSRHLSTDLRAAVSSGLPRGESKLRCTFTESALSTASILRVPEFASLSLHEQLG
ncbi:hypothetical protein RJ641_035500, partial [Dillenia turbinata]